MIDKKDPILAIKTSWSSTLGMGHIQRMTSLLWFLNKKKKILTYLICHSVPDSYPSELLGYVKADIDFSPDIIFHDKRDSSEQEITSLKKTGTVITIDDNGPGRKHADHAIDILPNPYAETKSLPYENFIYGYNFLRSLLEIKKKEIKKELDFAIYPGNAAGDEYINFLISLLPGNSDYAILKGEDSFIVRNNIKRSMDNYTHAEAILSSKVLISHFGLTIYEGYISGCRLITINPGEYHSKLSDIIREKFKLENIGVYNKFDIKEAVKTIKNTLEAPPAGTVKIKDVYNKIIAGLEEFYNLLKNIQLF